MEQIFLAVVFWLNNELVFLPDWHPYPMESVEICKNRKDMIFEQVKIIFENTPAEVAGVFCGTREEIHHKIKILDDIQV